MNPSAHITSIGALGDLKSAVENFCHDAQEALSANEMEIQRACAWLEEQLKFWKKEIRIREEAVITARNDLARRKMFKVLDRTPDCSEQEKALRRAQQRLKEAEEKLARTKHWGPELRRALDEYEGVARRLAGRLEADLPRAGMLLERKMAALESYVQMSAPSAPLPEALATAGKTSVAFAAGAEVPSVPTEETPAACKQKEIVNEAVEKE